MARQMRVLSILALLQAALVSARLSGGRAQSELSPNKKDLLMNNFGSGLQSAQNVQGRRAIMQQRQQIQQSQQQELLVQGRVAPMQARQNKDSRTLPLIYSGSFQLHSDPRGRRLFQEPETRGNSAEAQAEQPLLPPISVRRLIGRTAASDERVLTGVRSTEDLHAGPSSRMQAKDVKQIGSRTLEAVTKPRPLPPSTSDSFLPKIVLRRQEKETNKIVQLGGFNQMLVNGYRAHLGNQVAGKDFMQVTPSAGSKEVLERKSFEARNSAASSDQDFYKNEWEQELS